MTRWGIIGTGNISHQFATAVIECPTAELVAVLSRSDESASAFGSKFGVTNTYTELDSFLEQAQLDAVYIGTIHAAHAEFTIAALNAGKAVLCEKPLTHRASETARVIAAARETGSFLMEAIWTQFVPNFLKLEEKLQTGAIGKLKRIEASFAIDLPYDPDHRLYDAEEGGSLLDQGIYPLWLALWLCGAPESVASSFEPAPNGVDMAWNAEMTFANGVTALLRSSMKGDYPSTVSLIGEAGRIDVPDNFLNADEFSLTDENGQLTVHQNPRRGAGYVYEVEHVQKCLAEGLSESPALPLAFSQKLADLMQDMLDSRSV